MPSLRPYQEEAIEFGRRAGNRWVYADAAGSGKTPTASLWLAEALQGSSEPALIVAPDAVCRQWTHTISNWTDLEAIDLRGAPAARLEARERLQKGSVGVLSYDLLRRDHLALKGRPWGAVVFDEAHRLKGRSNATALTARALKAPAVAMLTGTPLLNTADELWTLLHLCRPKLYTSFWRWARKHFYVEMTTHHGKLDRAVPDIIGLRPGHDELIRAEAEGLMLWRDIDQLLPGLPAVTSVIVPVELGTDERALYDSVRKRGWGRSGDTVVTTKNAVARMTRLRQITSSWNGLGEGLGAAAKVETVAELVQGSSEQVVVLTAFKTTATELLKRLPGAVRYTGDENKKERHAAVQSFRSGDASCIVGTIAAMGEGVDGLQVAHRMVRLDRDWTPARNDQVIGRIRRSGQQANGLYVVDVVAEDTVDQVVAEALSRKQSVVDALHQ